MLDLKLLKKKTVIANANILHGGDVDEFEMLLAAEMSRNASKLFCNPNQTKVKVELCRERDNPVPETHTNTHIMIEIRATSNTRPIYFYLLLTWTFTLTFLNFLEENFLCNNNEFRGFEQGKRGSELRSLTEAGKVTGG